MRKQSLIIAVLTVVMLAMVVTACNIVTVVVKELSINVDTSKAKVQYLVNEEFSADGLVVTADVTYANRKQELVELKPSEYTLNSTAFDKTTPGEYPITVTYTLGEQEKSYTYMVVVSQRKYDGLSVKLGEGLSETYHLTEGSVKIDTSKIVVTKTDGYGDLLDEPVTDYTAQLYRGKEEIELVDGVATIEKDGAYQIWATRPSEFIPDYVVKAFTTIYVLDDVVSLQLNTEAEGTLTTQVEGKDEMSSTWKFIATYESGKTKELTAQDVEIEGLDTSTAGDYEASVTYTQVNAKGESVTTAPCKVNYSVTAKPVVGGQEVTVFANVSDLTLGDYVENMVLAEGVTVLAAADKKVTIDANKKELDGVEYTQRLKFNGKGTTASRSIKLEPQGAGKVVVLLITGSSSDLTRNMSFTDSAGTELANTSGIPNALTRYEFTFEQGGTYYLVPSAAINLYYIEMTYTTASVPETQTYTFDISALQEAIKTRLNVAEVPDKTQLEASDFADVNSFITFNGVGKSSDQYRTSKDGCIEIKGATLGVTFLGTGTLTVSFASTGGSNKSGIAVLNALGTKLVAQTLGEGVVNGAAAGEYEVTGTTFVTVTYEITEPGTYTIVALSDAYTRGSRIQTITMSDTH